MPFPLLARIYGAKPFPKLGRLIKRHGRRRRYKISLIEPLLIRPCFGIPTNAGKFLLSPAKLRAKLLALLGLKSRDSDRASDPLPVGPKSVVSLVLLIYHFTS